MREATLLQIVEGTEQIQRWVSSRLPNKLTRAAGIAEPERAADGGRL